MRTKFTLPVLLLVVLFVLQSCSKNSQQEILSSGSINEQVNVSMFSNSIYEYNLKDRGTVDIIQQASHFHESFTGIDENTGTLRYKYLPSFNYKGVDLVVLKSTTSITVNSKPGTSVKTITIKFKVY